MSSLWGDLVGAFIVLMMGGFIGIWIWAWLKRHRKVFDRMSRLPMEDASGSPDGRIPPTEPEDSR